MDGRGLFLRCFAGVYFCAFASYLVQFPGLYGRAGVLPVRAWLDGLGAGPTSLADAAAKWLADLPVVGIAAPLLHVDEDVVWEVTALVGTCACLACVTAPTAPGFLLIHVLYLSLFHSGQRFMSFQWDIFLLECGVVAALFAPVLPRLARPLPACPQVTWLLRWLAFRFMFSSGVVKITARDTTWQQLTAMDYHFATTCLPTYEAWMLHNLPPSLLRLSTALTFFTEIPAAFLFLCPFKWARRLSAVLQVALMLMIMLTGNYNWFNLHYAVLMVPVWDDDQTLQFLVPTAWWPRAVGAVLQVVAALVFCAVSAGAMFSVRVGSLDVLDDPLSIVVDMPFGNDDVMNLLRTVVWPWVLPGFGVWLAVVCALHVLKRAWHRDLIGVVHAVVVGCGTLWVFGVSCVPFVRGLDRHASLPIVRLAEPHFHATQHFQIAGSYGLFRSMTGVGQVPPHARDKSKWGWGDRLPSIVETPVVVVEGFDGEQWHEIEFRYKPGNVSLAPRRTAPHQPRLDWQMWFAALGSYHHNPWFLSFVHRLLVHTPEVIRLLDVERYPFTASPPKAVRAWLYHYDFTRLDTPWGRRHPGAQIVSLHSGPYWTRTRVREFLPAVSNDSHLRQVLGSIHLLKPPPYQDPCNTNPDPNHDHDHDHDLATAGVRSACRAAVRARGLLDVVRASMGVRVAGLFVDVHVALMVAVLGAWVVGAWVVLGVWLGLRALGRGVVRAVRGSAVVAPKPKRE